jgi:hypothetical protein
MHILLTFYSKNHLSFSISMSTKNAARRIKVFAAPFCG